MSGSSGTTTQVQKSDPWVGQQPFITDTLVHGQGIYDSGYQPGFYPNSTVAPFNPAQIAGQAAEFGYGAQGGSPAVGAGTNFETNLLNGAYLDPTQNPNWNAMASNIKASVIPQLEGQFTGGNTMNSPGAAYAVANGTTDALANAAGQQYGNTLNLMNSGAAYGAPALQNANFASIAAMQDAGNQQQTQAQNQLTADVQRWNYNQTLPMNMLDWYSSLVNGTGNLGGTTSLQTPYFGPSPAVGALTGALGGAATGASVSGPYAPYGAAAGAIIGGLGGYFGNGG